MKNMFTKTTAIAAMLVAGFAVGTPDAEAKKVRWKMHSAFGKNVAVIGTPPHRIADMVNRMSGGDFDIKVFEPGALAGGYAYYDPVSQGGFEAAWGTPGANQGKNSAFAFASTWPFGPGALEFNAWMMDAGGEAMVRDFYARDGIHYMYCGMIPPETSGWFRTEITSLDQLKGLKMRFFGMGAMVMQKFGVSTQQLAGGDIYPALELGTIDATEFSMPAIDRTLGFHQIAKFNYFPGWHQQSTTNEILVNKAKFDALPDDKRAMLEVACKANIPYMLANGESMQAKAMLANEKDGVKNIRWSQEVLDAIEGKWKEVLADERAKNADVAAMMDSFEAFSKEYRVWADMGYLK